MKKIRFLIIKWLKKQLGIHSLEEAIVDLPLILEKQNQKTELLENELDIFIIPQESNIYKVIKKSDYENKEPILSEKNLEIGRKVLYRRSLLGELNQPPHI